MSNVLFLVAMIGIVLLIVWLVQNDTGDPDSGHRGLFAFRSPKSDEPSAEPANPEPRWRRGLGRRS